jgi:hypothetical protein
VSKSVLGTDYSLDFATAIPLRTAEDTNRFVRTKYGYHELPSSVFRAFPQDETR